MTLPDEITRKKAKGDRAGSRMTGWIPALCCLLGLLAVLKNSEYAAEAVRSGARTALVRVIPALFPSMVLAGVLQRLKMRGLPLSRGFRKIFSRILQTAGLSASGLRICLLGILCGSPLAAKCVSDERDRSGMSPAEAEAVLFLASNPSPAFLIGAIGVGVHHSRSFGILLFLCTVLSTLLLTLSVLIFRIGFCSNYKRTINFTAGSNEYGIDFSNYLMDALLSSGKSCFLILLNLTFFSLAAKAVEALVSRLSLPAFWQTFLVCLPEMTGGFLAAASLSDLRASAFLSGFCAGFGGLSICFQILSIAKGSGIRGSRLLTFKLSQGLLSGFLFLLLS